jgi:hypothetical protein
VATGACGVGVAAVPQATMKSVTKTASPSIQLSPRFSVGLMSIMAYTLLQNARNILYIFRF